jgi:hypothetical protein
MVRHLVSRYDGRTDELLTEIEELLLSPDASASRQRIGLGVLRHIRDPRSAKLAARFLNSKSDDLRAAAASVLSNFSDPENRKLLRDLFQEDKDVEVRISAAGGLMGPEDYQLVLPWLMDEYSQKPRPNELVRKRLLGKIFHAPFKDVAEFVVGVALDGSESRGVHLDVLWMLRTLAKQGSNTAVTALDFLSVTAPKSEVRMMASRFLEEL